VTDPITPTQADRDAALAIQICGCATPEQRKSDIAAIEAYRHAAEERGARWAIEAGKRDHIDWYRLLKAIRKEHGSGMSDIAHGIVATFDALDPKAICDSARETDDAA